MAPVLEDTPKDTLLTSFTPGSYTHHITGSDGSSNMWGYATFTDGPVAVTYLSQMINTPIAYNYAFGSADGAQYIGSVCQNRDIDDDTRDGHAHLDSDHLVPAARQQVFNYTSGASHLRANVDSTLHFFWTGNNDVIASLYKGGRFVICDKDTLCIPSQDEFVGEITGCIKTSLTNLVASGAKHVLVPNIYPRHLSPWTSMWISPEQGMIDNFGALIDRTNSAIKSIIDQINSQHGSNIMYYDVNGFMKSAITNAAVSGLASSGYSDTCVDGCTIQGPPTKSNWDTWMSNTVENSKPDDFFWMTEVMPSTTIHKAIAADMTKFLESKSF